MAVPQGLVVLYSSPGMGHLVPMAKLAKLLAGRHGFSVTILTVEPHYNTGATAPFIAHLSSAHPTISFHRLPSVTPPPSSSPHHEALAFDLLRLSNPNLRHFLRSLPSPPLALIIDAFCSYALDVAADLTIPCYFFFSSCASVLAAALHFPALHDRSPASFRELGHTPLDIPGIPPLPADHMLPPMLDRDTNAYRGFLHICRRLPDAHGIIVNTFAALEPRAVDAISAGVCVTDGRATPPVYSVGPLVEEDRDQKGVSECLPWLDNQPRRSVVFLCFGSLGVFSAVQLREIAVGLEYSGQRFLWVVRNPPSEDMTMKFTAPQEPDLDALLPVGFVERTRERGLVVKSWAPQTAVLAHQAVGGFVSHCGWNSVMEAICAGVPIIGWPLYADHRMIKVFLVEEMELAVEMTGYDKELVSAAEVEERVRWLMESEGGTKLKERTVAAKESARMALEERGSSRLAVMELVGRW